MRKRCDELRDAYGGPYDPERLKKLKAPQRKKKLQRPKQQKKND